MNNSSGRGRRLAWCVHALTASGVVIGLAGLVAAIDGNVRAALIWLLVAQVIDGVDGPLARALRVQTFVPRLDGYALDLVVDFVTCVVVPVAVLYRFDLLPPGLSLAANGLIMFTTALWFARTDMCTDDHWFNGFPGVWNLVVPSLVLLGTSRWTNLVVVVGFSLLSLTKVKFVHPVRVDEGRRLTLAVTAVWLGSMTWATVAYPDVPPECHTIMLVAPLYFAWLTVRRTVAERRDELAGSHLALAGGEATAD